MEESNLIAWPKRLHERSLRHPISHFNRDVITCSERLLTIMYGPPCDCKGKFGREGKSAQMYSALLGDSFSGRDEMRACLSL
jgi:hypothetical protein